MLDFILFLCTHRKSRGPVQDNESRERPVIEALKGIVNGWDL